MIASKGIMDIDGVSPTGGVAGDMKLSSVPSSVNELETSKQTIDKDLHQSHELSSDERQDQHLYVYTVNPTSASRITLYHFQTIINGLISAFGPDSLLPNSPLTPEILNAVQHLTYKPQTTQHLKREARLSHEWYEELLWGEFRLERDARTKALQRWSGYFNGFLFAAASQSIQLMVVKNSWESPIKVFSADSEASWVLYQLHHHRHEIYTLQVPMTLRRWLELMVFGKTLGLQGLMELIRDEYGVCTGFFWQDRAGHRRYFKRNTIFYDGQFGYM